MAIPALARAPVMAGGGLDYDISGALAMTQEQTKVPVLEPMRPPENENLGTAIGLGMISIFATGVLASVLIAVGGQVELGIVAIVLGVICTGVGAGLFFNKLPLGGFSTLAGWVVACLVGVVVTCFIIFTAPSPVPAARPIASVNNASSPTVSPIEQAKAALQQVASTVPNTSPLEEQLARARARQDIAEMRRIVQAMAEEARQREAELKKQRAAARKMPLVSVATWKVGVDPRPGKQPVKLIAPDVIRFQNVGTHVRANCLVDDEFGSHAMLFRGEWTENNTINKTLIEGWNFETGQSTGKFDINGIKNGLFVWSQDYSKLFCRHFELNVRHALEAYNFKTGELIAQTPASSSDTLPNVAGFFRGPQDSIVIVGQIQPITIYTYKSLAASPATVSLPGDSSQPLVTFNAVCQSPGGRYLVICTQPIGQFNTAALKFYVVDVWDSAIAATFAVRPFVKPQVAFSPAGDELAVWCEEDGSRQSVAFINVATGTVTQQEEVANLSARTVTYPGRQLGYTRSGSHLIYEGRYLLPRKNPVRTIEMERPPGDWIILFGEFLGQYSFVGKEAEFHIVRLEGLPE